MRVVRYLFALSMLCTVPLAAGAQETRNNLVRLKATPLAAELSYARRTAPKWFGGVGLGVGPELWQRVLSSGEFFDPGDPFPNNGFDQDLNLAEFANLNLFALFMPSDHLQVEGGLRVAPVVWTRESGSGDASFAYFAGAFITPAVGWRSVKAGPRLQVGVLGTDSPVALEGEPRVRHELSVLLTLFQVEVAVRW